MTPQSLGFESWFDCYQHLKMIGFKDETRIAVSVPPAMRSTISTENFPTIREAPGEVYLDMVNIRAWAFDEIYPRIPFASSVQVAIEMAEDIGTNHQCDREMAALVEFLNKIPVKR